MAAFFGGRSVTHANVPIDEPRRRLHSVTSDLCRSAGIRSGRLSGCGLREKKCCRQRKNDRNCNDKPGHSNSSSDSQTILTKWEPKRSRGGTDQGFFSAIFASISLRTLRSKALPQSSQKNRQDTKNVEGWFQASAITSISTNTSFGKRATSTVERAGGAELKYF